MRRSQTIWSFVAATAVAGLVVAYVLLSRPARSDECAGWQEDYRAALEFEGGATGTLQFINMGPMEQLEAQRPDGCEIPSEP